MDAIRRRLTSMADALAARGVAPESITLAALLVSIAAGVALGAGGAAREPRVWLLVPLLGLARLALFTVATTLEARLVDCRASVRRPEERSHGQR